MKNLLTLFVIVALLGSCKKEENKAPTTPTPTPLTTTYLFNAVYTYGEPSLYLGFVLKVNGVTKTVPVNVSVGDVLVITAHDNLDNGYVLEALKDGVRFTEGNYNMQYGSTTWNYTVN